MSNKRARYDQTGSYRRRKRGPGSSGARGSGIRPLPVLRAPRISLLETQLDRLGVAIQRFRQFRSAERMNIQPASGKCRWYCVPHTMEYGMPMTITDPTGSSVSVLKQTPNSGDLFDIYVNLNANVGKGGVYVDTRNAPYMLGVGATGLGLQYLPGDFTQQDDNTDNKLWRKVSPSYRITKPGMDYTQRTQIQYDNVSSLDAFVEVYCLKFKQRHKQGYSSSNYVLGADQSLGDTMETNALNAAPVIWNHDTATHPGTDYCPAGIPADVYPNPIFGGSLLKFYADVCLYQRAPYYETATVTPVPSFSGQEGMLHTVDLGPSAEGIKLNSRGLGDWATQETRQQILCHPRVDPLRVTPYKHPTKDLGVSMTRVRAAQRIKPGQSARFDIPFEGTKHWTYADSPQGRKDQMSAAAVTYAGTEVVEATVYCFRVWGDMIHSKLEPGGTGAETDFQTGSTSVTFHTQRVIWARVRNRHMTIVNPQLMPFDTEVDLVNQEQINEETGAPELVKIAGDNVT